MRVKKRGNQRTWKSVLNFEIQPLFIEAGVFEKLARWLKYEVRRVLISKQSKMMCFNLIQVLSGRGPSLCQSTLEKCWKALLGFSPSSLVCILVHFGILFWDFFSRGLAFRRVFNPYSKNSTLFLII